MLGNPAVHQYLRGFVLPLSLLVRDAGLPEIRQAANCKQGTGLAHVPWPGPVTPCDDSGHRTR